MRNFFAFMKKECWEYTRNYKLFVMLTVFIMLGISNALMAKLLPEIIGSLATNGISIDLPTPTALDAWSQFFKNSTQIGLIVLVIVLSGMMASELSKGTLVMLLTKGLSRGAVILSKFTCMLLIWTLCLAVCFGLTYGYTHFLFPEGGVTNLAFSIFCLWLFGVFLLALLSFAATVTKSNYACLLITGLGVVLCTLIGIIPAAHAYNPLSLASDNVALLTNAIQVSSLYRCIGLTFMISILLLTASFLVFRKKQL